ncbi:uncharacterized protein I206_100667 [Kwoniella pini CBS 10737]|uniref:Uncharacterized protein n=1 Tax=Kwoniella pini CBS 10737 TaxID=1296096 RepID=A0A1B9ICU4_9TREE|nr:uncharacterized protein I206_00658 [Kwoniella pini CBS 10737]OCF53356.1 hypothetical protein I206_00658 [Kwoniella pini CBS 10737]
MHDWKGANDLGTSFAFRRPRPFPSFGRGTCSTPDTCNPHFGTIDSSGICLDRPCNTVSIDQEAESEIPLDTVHVQRVLDKIPEANAHKLFVQRAVFLPTSTRSSSKQHEDQYGFYFVADEDATDPVYHTDMSGESITKSSGITQSDRFEEIVTLVSESIVSWTEQATKSTCESFYAKDKHLEVMGEWCEDKKRWDVLALDHLRG